MTRHHFNWEVPDWRVDYDGPYFDVYIEFLYTARATPEIKLGTCFVFGTAIDNALNDEIVRRATEWFLSPEGYDEALRRVAYDQGMPR